MARMPWRKRSVRTIKVAEPHDAGTVDGLAYALYRPDGPAEGGVVVCPAPGEGLLRGLRAGRFDFEADAAGVERVIAANDTTAAAAALGDRLLVLHAENDEVVPVELSRELHAAAPGSTYVEVPG